MTPPNHHHSNTIEFSNARESLSSPSFDPISHGAVPLNESTDSLQLLELDKLAHVSNQGHTATIRVSSWSNLDFCINVSDTELEPRAETMKHTSAKNKVGPEFLSNKVTKQLGIEFSHESNHPASTTQRSTCKLSQNDTSSSASESKTFERCVSLGQTEQLNTISRNKKHSNLADKSNYNDRQMPLNHVEHSSSECSETEYIAASPKWVTSNTEDLYKAKSISKVSSVAMLLSEFDKIMELA